MKPIGVVTGASSGIGKAYAAQLSKTHDLVLIARRRDLLQEVSCQLMKENCKIKIMVADLSKERDLKHLEMFLSKIKVDILVNAAGFGDSHPFYQTSSELLRDMIYVHIIAATRLSRVVLSGMLEQENGVIVNVASVSGFSKVNAGNLVYDSTKAYLIRFSELLQQCNNLKNKVKIQVVCPGFTQTEFFSDYKHNVNIPRFLWMKPEDVVRRSIKNVGSDKTVYIPGWYNILIAWLIGNIFFLPFLKFINKYA